MPKPFQPSSIEPTPPADTPSNGGKDVLQTFLQQQARVEKQLSRWVACKATAADLCQELFIRLWRRRDVQVEDMGQYMMRSARNLAIDHLRSQRSRLRTEAGLVPEQWPAQGPSLETGHQAQDELERVEAALRGLPERTRHVFLLNRIHGQSYTQIARALGISASAVEKHMMRALHTCKSSIDAASPKNSR